MRRVIVAYFILITALYCPSLLAQEQELIAVETKLGVIYCELNEDLWVPGSVSKAGVFSSYASQIAVLKKKLKRATGKSRTNLQKKLATLKKKLALGKSECAAVDADPDPTPSSEPTPEPSSSSTPGSSATPTPTSKPTATPTSAPTSTPTQKPACYDAQRNTSCFGNAPLVGNETQGQSLFNNDCRGCHGSSNDGGKRNRSFSQIKAAFNVAQMAPYAASFSNDDIADLVAYLNRFNPNQ